MSNYVNALDAAYAVDRPEEAWLRGLVSAARPLFDQGLGVTAYSYDVTDFTAPRVGAVAGEGLRPGVSADVLVRRVIEHGNLETDFVADSHNMTVRFFHERGLEVLAVKEYCAGVGAADALTINGIDPAGRGVMLAAHLPARGAISA